jgi:Flp pilus assembly secretin CpaC
MPTIQSSGRQATGRFLPTVLLCGFAFCGASATESPPAAESVQQINAASRRIEISTGESLLLEYPDWLTTVKSHDPTVIRVSAVRPNRLRVTRVSKGTTTLQAIDRRDHEYSIEVVVQASTEDR